MYPNLEAELKRKSIRRTDIAEFLGCSISKITDKMTGDSDFSFSDAKKIKKWLGVDMPLEKLFANDDDAQVAV